MKELAVVKLTKSLFGKVGEKITAKKKKWADEAAISVEENKRREAEFKADLKNVKEKLKPAAIKEEIQKGVEATTKAADELKVKVEEGVRSESANEVMKASSKKTEVKPAAEKEEPKVAKEKKEAVKSTKKPASVKKEEKKVVVEASPKKAVEKTVAKESSSKPAAKKVEKKVTETKKPAPKKSVEKVSTQEAEAPKKSAPKKAATKTVASKKETVKPTATKKKATPAAKPASKKEAKLALYNADIKKHYGKVDEDFLAIVVKNLGPSIYKKDAELVSCSDSKELDTVRNNFLVKKLQMKESDGVLNGAIKEVCEELKASRNKYRATFYYALAKKFKLESKLS